MHPKQTFFTALLFLSAPMLVARAGKEKKDERVVHVSGTTPHLYTCPDGFEQHGSGELTSCLQHISLKPLAVCKHGELHGDQCIVKEPIIYTCPQGYYTSDDKGDKKKKGGVCAQVITSEAIPKCHGDRAVRDEACVRDEVAPIIHICPVASKKEKKKNNDCYEWVSVPSSLKCKPGYDLVGTSCYGHELQPCPNQDNLQDVLCVGYGCAGKGHLRRLGKKDDKKSHGKVQMCQVKVQASPYEVCPDGSMVTDKKKAGSCLRRQNVPLEPYCPLDGGVIDNDGQVCRITIEEDPEWQCPEGFRPCDKKFKSNECCRVEYAPPQPTCSSTASIYENHCAIFYPQALICEEGFALVDGVCKGYKVAAPKVTYSVNIKTIGNIIPPPVKK